MSAKSWWSLTTGLVFVILSSHSGLVFGQTVIARENFDGGAINLITGFDPLTQNLDGGPGDYYGVASLAAWPQGFPPGIPFSLCDDTVADVSNQGAGSAFPTDREGIFGAAADFQNQFFAISDTREWTDGGTPLVASWTFDISATGNNPLQLKIDLGQQADGNSFNGVTEGAILIEYSIDGGPFQTAISCDSFDSSGSGFSYRPMDSGDLPVTAFVMQATGPAGVTKISAETGLADSNQFLDKTPNQSSANAGRLDTFIADLAGSGSSIEIRISTAIRFEAAAFDNLEIVRIDPSFVQGDANGDGALDFLDIDAFVLALIDPNAYAIQYPEVDPAIVLDYNNDDQFSFLDIDGFIDDLLGG